MCLAVPGQILTADGGDPLMRQGRVDFGGIVKVVNLAYVPRRCLATMCSCTRVSRLQ